MPISNLAAIILAGGKGTRSENPSLPKILQTLAVGVTLLQCHLENLNRSGIDRVHFLLGFGAEKVLIELEKLRPAFNQIRFSWSIDDGTQGTLGPVAGALKELRDFENFLLILD